MKWTASATVFGLLAPLLASGAPVAQQDGAADTPVVQPAEPTTGYIVTLKPGIAANESATHIAWAGDLQRRGLVKRQEADQELKTFDLFDYKGYAGVFDEETIAEIEASDEVRLPTDLISQLTEDRSNLSSLTFLAI